jgi:hypothetical protein
MNVQHLAHIDVSHSKLLLTRPLRFPPMELKRETPPQSNCYSIVYQIDQNTSVYIYLMGVDFQVVYSQDLQVTVSKKRHFQCSTIALISINHVEDLELVVAQISARKD